MVESDAHQPSLPPRRRDQTASSSAIDRAGGFLDSTCLPASIAPRAIVRERFVGGRDDDDIDVRPIDRRAPVVGGRLAPLERAERLRRARPIDVRACHEPCIAERRRIASVRSGRSRRWRRPASLVAPVEPAVGRRDAPQRVDRRSDRDRRDGPAGACHGSHTALSSFAGDAVARCGRQEHGQRGAGLRAEPRLRRRSVSCDRRTHRPRPQDQLPAARRIIRVLSAPGAIGVHVDAVDLALRAQAIRRTGRWPP